MLSLRKRKHPFTVIQGGKPEPAPPAAIIGLSQQTESLARPLIKDQIDRLRILNGAEPER